MRDSQGREIVDIEFDRNSDGSRYITRAYYLDDCSEVPEDELYELEKGQCVCAACWVNR